MSTALARSDVQAAAHGDREAFRRIVSTHQTLVTSLALAVVREEPLSRDIAQEVFLHVWSGLGSLRNPDSLIPWLRQLTRNRARLRLRFARRHPEVRGPDADVHVDLAPSDSRNALEQLLDVEQQRRLSAAIAALPASSREVVILFYREGQSVEQVAALLELSAASVRKRLQRARDALRASLLEEVGTSVVKDRADPTFASAVIAALPVTGPALSVAGSTRWLLTGKVSLALGTVLVGVASALLGLEYGHRVAMRCAVDEVQRARLRRLRNGGLASVLLAGAGWALAIALHAPRAGMLVTLGYFTSMWLLYGLWAPRFVWKRQEDEGPLWRKALRVVVRVALFAAVVSQLYLVWRM